MKMAREQLVTLIVVSIAIAMVFIDMTILSVALAPIQKSFNASRGASQWVVNIFLLVSAVMAVGAGRISDMIGHHKTFVFGTLVFVFFSLLCGLSFNIEFLIFARACQALGGAFILIGGMSLLSSTFSNEDRGRANGIAMSVATIMTVSAPFLGGVIIQFSNWHWIFFINVVLGALIFFPLLKLLKQDNENANRGKFDITGFLVLAIFIVAMTVTCDHVIAWGWISPQTLLGFLISIAALVVFIYIEKRKSDPLIHLKLFNITNYSPGCLIMAMSQVINYFVVFFGVFMENALRFSPFITGILLLPAGILLSLFSSYGGKLADKYGARLPMVTGLILITVGYLTTTLFIKSLSYFAILPALIGYGIGACFLSNPLRTSMLKNTPKENFGMATSILSGTRQIGGVIGFAIIGSIIVGVENAQAKTQLLKVIPNLSIEKIQSLLGILSHTASSQSVLSTFDTKTQGLIQHIILNSYVTSFYDALILMSIIMFTCLLLAIAFIKR